MSGFKLKSGNTSPFKQLGSSPAKDLGHGGHLGLSKTEAAKRDHGGKMSDEDKSKRVKKNTKNLAIESVKTVINPIATVIEKEIYLPEKEKKVIEKRKKDDKRKENIKKVIDNRTHHKNGVDKDGNKIIDTNRGKEVIKEKKKKKKEKKDKEYENLPKLDIITPDLKSN